MDGLFTSKLRYGIQLMGKVRMTGEDSEGAEFKAVQLVQNNLLRTLNGTKTKDQVSILSMLTKFKMQSVNQLNANVKLLEAWKALNIEDYPLSIKRQSNGTDGMATRADCIGRPIEIGKTNLVQKTFASDLIHIWNKAPNSIKESKTLYQAKRNIKLYVKSLPV